MNFEINKKNARLWSRLGPRAVYGQAISSLSLDLPNLIAISADLGRSSGLDGFSKEYPEKFINAGIAEQNMVGFSAGLARMGFKVFASTFAPFASMRAAEQVRMNLGYMEEEVKLIALGSGLAMGFLGNSHFGLEDLAIIHSIPNIDIICPSDGAEIHKAICALATSERPTYVRLTGGVNNGICYENDYDFGIGKAVWLKEPTDTVVISHGASVARCKMAIEKLEMQHGKKIGLLNMHTIRPLDEKALHECFQVADKVLVVEEHFEFGGLGQIIMNFMHANGLSAQKLALHGIKNKFMRTGDYDFMLEQSQLCDEGIKNKLELMITNRSIGAINV